MKKQTKRSTPKMTEQERREFWKRMWRNHAKWGCPRGVSQLEHLKDCTASLNKIAQRRRKQAV